MSLPKPCLDCGTPTRNGSRCPTCQHTRDAKRDAQRGTRQERGYDRNHDRTRETLLAAWRAGDPCSHCGKPMWDKTRLDLAHTSDRKAYRGLAHDVCNRGNR